MSKKFGVRVIYRKIRYYGMDTHSIYLSEYHQEGRMWGRMGIGIC
jgi:hypothetical protein